MKGDFYFLIHFFRHIFSYSEFRLEFAGFFLFVLFSFGIITQHSCQAVLYHHGLFHVFR